MKIIIAEPTHEILEKKLKKNGFDCDYFPSITFQKLKSIIPKYDGLIIRSKFKIDKEFINSANKLKFVARAGAGMENIDIQYAQSKNVLCINSPEGNKDSVGEHVIGMLLSLFHKISISNKEINKGIWNRKNIGIEMFGKTVGILGYGNMGSSFAKKLKGFGVDVIAYDKYKTKFSDEFVTEVNEQEFFERTDILSIHVPLTDETLFLVNNSYINNFKKTIYIANTARGKIIKTEDLVNNLKSGKIKGAVLDVLEYEKTSFENIFSGKDSISLNYLISSDNVILTPHIAGSSDESYKKIAKVLAEKIILVF